MPDPRLLQRIWTVCLVLVGIALIVLTLTEDFSLAAKLGRGPALILALATMAFFCEYVDSSIGMGYGTTLTPILLIMGFTPLEIVPAVLFSELISGISAGLLHHRIGNVDLSRGTRARRITTILSLCSVAGAVAAVAIAVNLPKNLVKLYIGIMIVGIGVFILVGRHVMGGFSWSKIVGLGTLAAFNKGISGGGYGPLVTGGQVLVGVPEKNAVGITSFAEGVMCLVGLTLYIVLEGALAWHMALPLAAGAILSVPAATWTVKILPEKLLRQSIGYATLFLGALTLIKVM